jgi:hypothetical protein
MLTSATEEARRRGDRRLGTGLLHGVGLPDGQALGYPSLARVPQRRRSMWRGWPPPRDCGSPPQYP